MTMLDAVIRVAVWFAGNIAGNLIAEEWCKHQVGAPDYGTLEDEPEARFLNIRTGGGDVRSDFERCSDPIGSANISNFTMKVTLDLVL